MPAKAVVIQVEPDLAEAFNSASEQERERVKIAMRAVLKIVPPAPKKAHRLSKNESELFQKINGKLSVKKQKRYDELTEKREDGLLTDKEHAELMGLITELERIGVERLRAVIELAKLRKVPPEQMLEQLELDGVFKAS